MEQASAKLWAKSPDKDFDKSGEGESLLRHSLNVAKNAQLVCERLPFAPEVREEIAACLIEAGAFHDIGKAASGFQRMLREKGFFWKRRHETLSTALARALNPEFDECALFAVLTHHRNIPEGQIKNAGEKCLPVEEVPAIFTAYENYTTWEQMLTELRENWPDLEEVLFQLRQQHGFAWQKIDSTNDFLDFGIHQRFLFRDYQKKYIPKEKRWRASLLRGLLITSDHLASAVDRETGEHPDILDVLVLTEFEDAIKQKELPAGKDLLTYQEKAAETKGNAILKAPTGAGKTLAAMLWARRNQSENGRLFYVLPFTASINAMAKRFIEIFGENHVGVLHHKNADFLFRLLEKDEMSLRVKNKQAKHLKSLAKEMYRPIRVTTPHQILRFALRGRGWETGLAEFMNSCVIFDEVHAFEPLITGLTLATARLLTSEEFNAKVLFTSATIPKFLEKLIEKELEIDESHIIEPNPKDKKDAEICDKKRHKIEVREGDLFDNLPEVIEEIKESRQSTLIFCNHVKTSQQVYEELRNSYGFTDVTLLHSRFNGRDRTEIETKITRKKTKEEKAELADALKNNPLQTPILVATQAVEVSLDIDYERGYSEPAPADALGQRLGRVNRKGERNAAPIVIYAEPTNGHLYDETLTEKTVELLRDVKGELSEQELTSIVDGVYENGYSPAAQCEFEKGLNNESIKNFADEIIAGTHVAWTDTIFEQTDAQIEVLPQSLYGEFSDLIKEKLDVQARQLFVPIRWGTYHKAKAMNAIRYKEDLREYIVTFAYDKYKGLDTDNLDGSNFC
jgi:CRISPR-associated endonuclease/helicase Cas3